jgi:hypothetical protein
VDETRMNQIGATLVMALQVTEVETDLKTKIGLRFYKKIIPVIRV